MESKPIYLSKTFWTNIILGVAVVIWPQLGQYITTEVIAAIFVVANIALRLISKDTVQLWAVLLAISGIAIASQPMIA